jgi:hypothetical protein
MPEDEEAEPVAPDTNRTAVENDVGKPANGDGCLKVI